jgi:hypothetical protein
VHSDWQGTDPEFGMLRLLFVVFFICLYYDPCVCSLFVQFRLIHLVYDKFA